MKTIEKEKEFEQSLEKAAHNYGYTEGCSKVECESGKMNFKEGAKWAEKYIFDWLEQEDFLTRSEFENKISKLESKIEDLQEICYID